MAGLVPAHPRTTAHLLWSPWTAAHEPVLGPRARCGLHLERALTEQHTGSGGNSSGRRGRIKGSVNLPAAHLLDSATNEFLPAAEVRRRFEAVGAFGKQAITYCGGSIAASADAFALVMLDHPDVKLYGASLSEWAIDPTLPMETG